ncbi:hypothetical protein [Halorarius litoreus]|uniref:hypothetical protein n=1 Tax=Halorarius litoreus TaxID=2962676 RepID=UPI0020CC59AA|nr:hypothetical protein [Halorarius litoreus]
MDCPRCGSLLTEFEYRGRETAACEGCGFVGVSVDHHSELQPVESWSDALRRFNEKN